MNRFFRNCKVVFNIKSFGVIVLSICLYSCHTIEKVGYFQDLKGDTAIINKLASQIPEPKIKPNDVLEIIISSISPEASSVFNGSAEPFHAGANNVPSFQVDKNGDIHLLKIGKLHVEGMVVSELKELLQKLLLPYLKEPIAVIHLINLKVTVIGEFVRPEVIPMNGDKISILDVIAESSDILPTGRKDNILLIRNTDSGRIFRRINLLNSSIFTSPYFYLKPDDVLYVDKKPLKKPLINFEIAQIIGLALSAVSLLVVIFRTK